jgi:hypothetical protein
MIEFSYKKANYFDVIFPMLSKILDSREKDLSRYIGFSLEIISSYLDINTDFHYSSLIKKNNTLKGEAKILDICESMEANIYINSIGGMSLYKRESFLHKGIELKFLKSELVKYKQFQKEFVPNLSIIDILMFNSKEEVKGILTKYFLI